MTEEIARTVPDRESAMPVKSGHPLDRRNPNGVGDLHSSRLFVQEKCETIRSNGSVRPPLELVRRATPKTAQYLRVSLINECNLGCFYCKPRRAARQSANRTTLPTYMKAIAALHKFGVRKIRFTGGEPTLYKGLTQLVSMAKSLSADTYIGITTNGLLFDRLAQPLAEAGLDSVNISLDTIDRDKFVRITGVDKLPRVLATLEAAVKFLPRAKLNCVVMAGINDNETEKMIRFAESLGIDIRFIEFMSAKHTAEMPNMFVSGAALRRSLPFELTPIQGDPASAARYFISDRFRIKIGFIEPVSNPFCAGCNRLRLSSDGRLYNCLFSSRSIDITAALAKGEESALRQVQQLLAPPEQIPDCTIGRRVDDLPSFINIGG